MSKRFIFLFLLVFLATVTHLSSASYNYASDAPPFLPLSTMVPGLHLWKSHSFAGDFREVVRDWHLERLISKGGLSIGWVEGHQEVWLTVDPEDKEAAAKLKDAVTVILRSIVFNSKKDALAGANFVKEAPFVGNLSPGSFTGRPIGDLVWSSKKPNATPDYGRPLEILFVKSKTVIYFTITKPPVTKWRTPVNAAWVENLAGKIAERM